ncbi:MAG: hypothetical protein RLZZ301_843 [Bacteroidota bacterium]|jgi:hypothetical protein
MLIGFEPRIYTFVRNFGAMHLFSDYSLWWCLPILAFSAWLTWMYYRRQSWLLALATNIQWLIRALRFLSLSTLLILLLGIVVEALYFREEKPLIISLIDQSESLQNYKDSKTIPAKLAAYQAALANELGADHELIRLPFGSKSTNMEHAFTELVERYYNRNVGAVVLVSDGNYNQGAHPSYAADKLALTPIYGLAVGDTIPKKDQLIKDVLANEICFLKNEFLIEVAIEAFRMPKQRTTLALYQDGKRIASQPLQHSAQKQSFQTLQFQCTASKVGLQSFTLKLEDLPGEYSIQNNTRTIYIEVIDARSNILLVSAAPHPDISALAQTLKGNENYHVECAKVGAIQSAIQKQQLVIWQDPGLKWDAQLYQTLKKAKVPVWFLLGTQTDNSVANQLDCGLKFQLRPQTEEVQATLNSNFILFQLQEDWTQGLAYLPPLIRRFGEVKAAASTQLLLQQRIGQIDKKEALLSVTNDDQWRRACLLGEGLWQWRLSDFQKHQQHDLVDGFLSKLVSFLLVKDQGAGLRIDLPKRFTTDDDFVAHAAFYNAALEPITSPVIRWTLLHESGQRKTGEFAVKGNAYEVNQGQLKAGRYTWTAQTTVNGKTYKKSSQFVVEAIALEKLESAARHQTLAELARPSGGRVFQLSDYPALIKALKRRNDIATVQYEEHRFEDLSDFLSLFLVLFMLLSLEWFLRRYYGTY